MVQRVVSDGTACCTCISISTVQRVVHVSVSVRYSVLYMHRYQYGTARCISRVQRVVSVGYSVLYHYSSGWKTSKN